MPARLHHEEIIAWLKMRSKPDFSEDNMQITSQFDGKTGSTTYLTQNRTETHSMDLLLSGKKEILQIKHGRIVKTTKLKEFCHSV